MWYHFYEQIHDTNKYFKTLFIITEKYTLLKTELFYNLIRKGTMIYWGNLGSIKRIKISTECLRLQRLTTRSFMFEMWVSQNLLFGPCQILFGNAKYFKYKCTIVYFGPLNLCFTYKLIVLALRGRGGSRTAKR